MKERAGTITISSAIGGLLMVMASMVMLCWVFYPEVLLWWFNRRETAPTRFNVALAIFLLGWSIMLLNRDPLDSRTKNRIYWLTGIVFLFSLLSMSEYVFKIELGIDDLFVNQKQIAGGRYTGNAPLITLLALMAITATIQLVCRQRIMPSIILIIITLLVSFLLLGEAIVGVSLFTNSLQSWKVSYMAGVIMTLMLFAIFMSQPLTEFRRSVQVRITAFSLVAILALAVVFSAFYQNQLLQKNSRRQILEIYQIINKAQSCNNAFAELENNWRDFIYSKDTGFLRAYLEKVDLTEKAIHDFRVSSTEGTDVSNIADSLLSLLNRHSSGIDSLVLLTESQDRFALFAEKNIYINQAIALSEKITVKKLALERFRLIQQHEISHQYQKIFILFGVIAVLIMLAGIAMIVIILRKKAAAKRQLKLLNESQAKDLARATQEIKQKELYFETLVRNMNEGVQVIGFDWKFIYVNETLARRSQGISAKEFLGNTLQQQFPGIEYTELFKNYERCMIERKPSNFEYNAKYPDGSNKWFLFSVEPVPEGILVISSDIDKVKTANLMLNDYKMALDASSVITITDAEGYITYVNQKFCELSGYSEQELIGQHSRIVNSGIHDKEYFERMWDTIRAGKVWRGEICNRNKDGRLIWFYTVIIPFLNEDNVPYQYMRIRYDISAKKKIEQENDKIRKDLQEQTDELQRSNAELKQYAYAASHDLQEPARMVSNFTGLLQKQYGDKLDATAQTYLQFTKEGALRMKSLINDMLEIGKLSHSEFEKEETDLNEVLELALHQLKNLVEKQKGKINFESLPVVYCNAEQIKLVFVHLIDNALKFRGQEDPVVHIAVQDKGDFWQFCISDNGIGIEKEFYDQVFVIFQRLNRKEEFPGNGIGLAIVKKIITLHQGQIWVESESGKGSRFYFTLPKR